MEQLPPELLIEIMQTVCDENVIKLNPRSYELSVPALSVSMVCSTWRAVALSASCIWASLRLAIVVDNSQRRELAAVLRLLRKHLAYSKQHPLTFDLSLHVGTEFEGPDDRESIICHIIDCLSQESYRWRDVSLDIGVLDPYARFARIQGNLPLLESVCLRFDRHEILLGLFQDSPKLHTLLYNGAQDLDVPQHLRSLEFRGFNGRRLQHHISSYSDLKELVCSAGFDKFGLRAGIITSTGLESLVVSVMPVRKGEISIWRLFSFPNLQVLDIRLSRFRHGQPLQTSNFSNFLTRSNCVIRKISITGLQDTVDVESVVHILEMVPSLTTLTIHEGRRRPGHQRVPLSDLESVVKLFYSQGASKCRFAKLENIELAVNSDVVRQLWVSIREMIQSRAGLRGFKLIVWDSNPSFLRTDTQLFDTLHALSENLSFSVYYK